MSTLLIFSREVVMLRKTARSQAPRYNRATYKVCMMVEFYKEMLISAACEKEARELAEARVRGRQSNMFQNGYSFGDIEILETEEL
jgi:hypothetical protein